MNCKVKTRRTSPVCWDLCDKVSASPSDLNEVAEKIAVALAAHGQAIKRFATGRGNTLSIGDRISNLGVKTKKPMPAMLVGGFARTDVRGV